MEFPPKPVSYRDQVEASAVHVQINTEAQRRSLRAGLHFQTGPKGFGRQVRATFLIAGVELQFGDRVLLTGSVNLTHNRIQNNLEHKVVIYDPLSVSRSKTAFEEL